MDPLTHTLTAAALGETGLNRLSRYAGAALLIGANLPDVDVLSYLAGTDAGFGYRRGLTHGVLALALWPFILVALLWAWDRLAPRSEAPGDLPLRPARLLAAAAVGVFSHPFLDWLNTYGIRLLSPFDDRWFYGDAVFIVDPWLWWVLGSTVFLARRDLWPGLWLWVVLAGATSTLVLGSGTVPRSAKGIWLAALAAVIVLRAAHLPRWRPQVVARWGLALAALQVALLLTASVVGKSWVRGEMERQGLGAVEDLMVGPTPADPFRWQVVARSAGTYRHGTLRWSTGPQLQMREHGIPIDPAPAVVEAARESPCVAGTLAWMRFPFAEVESTSVGYSVRFIDARYTRELGRGLGTSVVELDRGLVPRDCGESP